MQYVFIIWQMYKIYVPSLVISIIYFSQKQQQQEASVFIDLNSGDIKNIPLIKLYNIIFFSATFSHVRDVSRYSNVVIFIQISLVHPLRINDFFLVVSSHCTVCAFHNQRSKHISSWSYTANFVQFSIQFLGGLFELFVQKILKKFENIRFHSKIKINKNYCNCNWK